MPVSHSLFQLLGSSREILSPAGIAGLISGIGAAYWCFTTTLICIRTRNLPPAGSQQPPPVTFLRPIKIGVRGLKEKIESLIQSTCSGDQILLGVESNADAHACEQAAASAPSSIDVRVIRCLPLSVPNPKIAKLIQLSGHARHEHCILTDSEAILDREFMQRFRAEWMQPGVAALTAGYRFAGARCLPEQLDHLPALLTLWPGLAITELATKHSPRGLGLTLGACTGLRNSDLEAIGGWNAFAGYLAEDNRMGAALGELGKPVCLSTQVLTLDSDPMTWSDWLRHQHRVAVTYRVCNPAGVAGMIFTQGLAWAGIALILSGFSGWAWVLLCWLAALRVATAFVSGHALRFPCSVGSILLASLAETAFWCVAWLPLPVRWGAKSYRLQRGGRMLEP